MGGRVLGAASLIVGRGEDLIALHDDRTDGNLILFPSEQGLVIRMGHKVFVIAIQFGWEAFFKGILHQLKIGKTLLYP